jgi:putative DNA methylase
LEDKSLIEETFPVREVSEESTREKNIRHGHISTLHIWWARRPLAASRATIYAALVPPSKDDDEFKKKREFIARLSKWENSLNQDLIEKARKEILEANGGKPPRVLDPFAGGGSIPLEALRLGCETYASDYNPVATLILKCTLEYPQKYGHSSQQGTGFSSADSSGKNRLLEDVKKWGNWVLEEARKELGRFYPSDKDGSIPVGYIWARTIPCQNPSCGAEIPLMRQFWLAKKSDKKVSLYPYASNGKVNFKIVGTGYEKMPSGFNPDLGTVSRAIGRCLVCGSIVDDKTTRKLFCEGKAGQRMVAVVLHKPKVKGKRYRIANSEDMKAFIEAEKYLEEKRKKLFDEWGMDPVPDEPLKRVPVSFGVINVWVYGMNTWGDLFNARQKLALITFVEKVREAFKKMIEEGYGEEYTEAVVNYLALVADMTAAFTNELCRWENTSEAIKQLYSRQALPMLWDYAEVNPFSASSGSSMTGLGYYYEVMKHCSQLNSTSATVSQFSATSLPYPNNDFEAVITDPPYYDNVPYSYLSDFFYVWLKRTVGHVYPELFATPLTPKNEEIVAYSNKEGGFEEGKKYFEDMLKKSFKEIYRVLKPNGVSVIIYAHKSVAGWETLVNSLLDSGLVVSGAWPIHTEMKARLRASESAALASSIYMVARKAQRAPIGFYNEVKQELKKHLNNKLDQIWNEGISGADFFISAIGSAIEVFGKYERVIDDEGNVARANRFLEDIRKIVTDYAVKQVLHNGFAAEIKSMTRFYVLWRWAYRDKVVEFDEARKLGQSVGLDVAQEWNKGFISKKKEFIEVLGPEERKPDGLENSTELIDVLHKVLLLWKKGKSEEIANVLRETGYGKSDVFYRVAQSISESLPNESKEKKLLDGFLAGRQRISDNLKKDSDQKKLFDDDDDNEEEDGEENEKDA